MSQRKDLDKGKAAHKNNTNNERSSLMKKIGVSGTLSEISGNNKDDVNDHEDSLNKGWDFLRKRKHEI